MDGMILTMKLFGVDYELVPTTMQYFMVPMTKLDDYKNIPFAQPHGIQSLMVTYHCISFQGKWYAFRPVKEGQWANPKRSGEDLKSTGI